MVFALASPEGMQGLVQRLRGREDWTLTRRGIPPRPATIKPWQADAAQLDPARPVLTVRGLNKRSARWSWRRASIWRCIRTGCTA